MRRNIVSGQHKIEAPPPPAFTNGATLTRLHLRYTRESAPDDLVFKIAKGVHGGIPDVKGAMTSESNRFQGRYLMWVDGCSGSSAFANMFGARGSAMGGATTTATEMVDAFEQIITSDIHELDLKAQPLPKELKPLPEPLPAPAEDDGVTYLTTPGVKTIEIETPGVVGALDPELVRKVVHANRGQIRYCYEVQLQANPALAGHATFAFELDARGVVTSSSLVESALGNDAATTCMTGRIRTWMFPRPKDGKPVKVKIGFKFTAPGQ